MSKWSFSIATLNTHPIARFRWRRLRSELAALLPDASHRLAEFFVRDVQIALRLLDVRVAEHQLDRSDVDAVSQQPAGAFVTQVVPVQIDLPELLAIDPRARLGTRGVDSIGHQQQRLPSGLEAGLKLPGG